jgi:hypothetical protein
VATVAHAWKETSTEFLDLTVREWRGPTLRSRMLPEAVDHTKRHSCAHRDALQRRVPYSASRKAHDDDDPTRTHELHEARKCLDSIGVVQRGHGYNGIE